MKTKQIVFTDFGKAELLATDCEMPKEGEVLISLAYSTISCGTERANLMGDKNVITFLFLTSTNGKHRQHHQCGRRQSLHQ